MTDIVAFLNARLDEDEALALRWEADEHVWQVVGGRRLTYGNGAGENVVAIDVTNKPFLWWERIYVKRDLDGLAEHIARHDPARVLREVKAKREVLSSYVAAKAKVESRGEMPDGVKPTDLIAAAELGVLKVIVRDFAAAYADHPDYDQAWRVDA